MSLLEVRNLGVTFSTPDGTVRAVNQIRFDVDVGETLAIVGESGSGKSQAAFAIMGLLAENGCATGSVRFNGTEIIGLTSSQMNKIRASEVAMIFQDPMTSLNPYMRVRDQMVEVLVLHKGMSRSSAIAQSERMLDAVQIPDAKSVILRFPHECSGGMRQRIMIAMALLCQPKLLIADEPTTALDVTVQAQIMALLKQVQSDFGTAIVLITHDLGVVAGSCKNTLVLYGGRVLEHGRTRDIFASPSHPYTRGLLSAVPRIDDDTETLTTIAGSPPNMMALPKGCPFAERCDYVMDICHTQVPDLVEFGSEGHSRACHLPREEL